MAADIPRKSIADRVIEMIAGNSQDEIRAATTEEESTIASSERIPPKDEGALVSSNCDGAVPEEENKIDVIPSRKRKPGTPTAIAPVEETTTTNDAKVEEPISDANVSMSEAKEKVQAQVSDVLERQMAGETTPPRQKETEPVGEERAESVGQTLPNGSLSSIGESPLKTHVIETEEMARAGTISEKAPESQAVEKKGSTASLKNTSKTSLKSTSSKGYTNDITNDSMKNAIETSQKDATTASIKSATNASMKSTTKASVKSAEIASLKSATNTLSPKSTHSKDGVNATNAEIGAVVAGAVAASGVAAGTTAAGDASNHSLRDASVTITNTSTTSVAVHSGTFWKQGKYVSCSWKERHFQLFSTGELKWYFPGNSATVKGSLSNVNSSSMVTSLEGKKVSVTRADKSKLPLHMLALKVQSVGDKQAPRTMLLGMESQQEMTTFIEKVKQINPTATNN